MADKQAVDGHLCAVFDEMVTAIQEIKQAVWSSSSGAQRQALEDLRRFVVDSVTVVADAEERIEGRSPSLASPTGHPAPNLLAETRDEATLLRRLRADLQAIGADIRQRAAAIAGSEESEMLANVADGLDERLARLPAG